MIEKYEKYLEKIDNYLQKFFLNQAPYIKCKKGCSICCEEGDYPFSELEFKYIMIGYDKLNKNERDIIDKKIKQLKISKEKFQKEKPEEKFFHACPFLINKKCSVYKFRGLICRSYGLPYFSEKNGKTNFHIPCCVSNGLNYSNVYDEKTGTFSSEKWQESGIDIEPVSFNISLDFLLDNEMTRELKLEFGEAKVLLDWV